jgi:hypothetical protein
MEMGLARHEGDHWTLAGDDLPSSLDLWRTAIREYPDSIGELALFGADGRGTARRPERKGPGRGDRLP